MRGLRPTRCASSNVSCSPTPTDGVDSALAGVGCVDEAELAAAIRSGELDGRQRPGAIGVCVRWSSHRLAAAHPGYQDE